MSDKTALIMAGGTGGHVFPGLALAEVMIERGYQVRWLGTSAGIESRLVPEKNIKLHVIPVKGIRGKGIKSLFLAPWNIVSSVFAALAIIRRIQPSVVVGLGGFVAGPGGIAARLLGLPLVIHEQNAVPGTTNRLLSKVANRVLLAFPCHLAKGICIGNPVRKEIENLDPPEMRMNIDDENVKVLILGGSRGAKAINELVPHALSLLTKKSKLNIWHQTGADKEKDTLLIYRKLNLDGKVQPFIDDMAEAFSWADFVICRAGALTVSELAAVGLGSLLIPFPHAIDDHQTENASYLEKNGAAIIEQQVDLNAEKLADVLSGLLFNKNVLLEMAKKARALSKLHAAEKFADHCEEALYA